MNREERWEKYGYPERLADDIDGEVLVFGHTSQEAAEVSAKANREEYGHPCEVEQRNGRWVTVVDLRPRLAEIDRSYRDGV